ncbi:OmpA family protein [Luteimonas sp. RIT-PG2_3]
MSGIVLKEGTFPNIDNLRAIGPGVTKDQLYDLLGRPHFREGLVGVREWDYLFHFRTADGVVTCQYKVIFDKDYRGQGFHWAPESCAERIRQQGVAAQASVESRVDLSADALFAFARSGLEDILPGGREQLTALAAQLSSLRDPEIRVVGHTDRIGSDVDNLVLSQRRAETVRRFLVDHGVQARAISAEGRGEVQPVTTDCDARLQGTALVNCLKPDRRVELFVRARSAD